MDHVVVVGAGIGGLAASLVLSRVAGQVTLVERAGVAQGTTGSTFAWINSNQKVPEDYYALNLAGVRAHRELR